MKTPRAQAIPGAYFENGAWYLPPPPYDPEAARIARLLFRDLDDADLNAAADLAYVDVRPIDRATPFWEAQGGPQRPVEDDGYPRVLAAMRSAGMEPHGYQRSDVAYAVNRLNSELGAYLAWEVGLGKTLGACMAIEKWAASFVVVVCPNSAKLTTWQPALQQYTPWLGIVVLGNGRAAVERDCAAVKERLDNGLPTVFVVHYEALSMIANLTKAGNGWARFGTWDLVVFDEAHRLRNPKAQFVRAAHKVKSVGSLLLSGSVTDGAVEDLFVPMKRMHPLRYRAKWRDWNDRFVHYVEDNYGRIAIGPLQHRLAELRAELGVHMVVRRAADELDIPVAHRIDHAVPLLPAQQKAYDELTRVLLAELPDGDILAVADGATLVAGHRRITAGLLDAKGRYLSAKLDRAEELARAAAPAQVVLFCWHKAPARALAARLGAALVTGDVPVARRAAEIERFKGGQVRYLVATMATLSESVNLQNASQVILVEESYVPKDNEQSIGRVVRQGQTANATIHVIRAENTVDLLRVAPIIRNKTQLRRALVGR